MILTEWRRRRIIRQEYERIVEEGFRAEVRRQLLEQTLCGNTVETWQGGQVMVMSLVPVMIVGLEAFLMLR